VNDVCHEIATTKDAMLASKKDTIKKGYWPTRAIIETNILKKNKVIRPIYHGGSLTGGASHERTDDKC